MTEPRKHHFVSQFYLAGFTTDESSDGTLYCFDVHTKKVWPTNTKEVAHKRDFNRVEASELTPAFLETELSKFETEVSSVFRSLKTEKVIPSGDEYATLINFIALLGVRNPDLRSNFDESKTQLFRKVMALYLHDEQRWQTFRDKAIRDGVEALKGLSYSEANKIFLESDWKITSHPNSFHPMEFGAIEKVVELLANRDWTLVLAPSEALFVTSDRPVALTWTIPDPTVPFGPGFGSLHSAVYFTLNRTMALLGRFNDTAGVIQANAQLVGAFNSIISVHATRFVYGSTNSFLMLDENERLANSQSFLGIAI